jgi:hypothetical protein
MGKKQKAGNNDIYQQDQVNKKHRVKSEKLQKRIEKKRNKKKVKEIHHAKRTLFKFIISNFHQRKQKIDLTRLPLDFKEIQKTVRAILSQKDMDSVNRLLTMFDTMEKTVKEIDITTFKNKTIIKDVAKFMRVMHVQQNPKNPMKYSLYHMFRKRDPKVRYTTNVDEMIPECLSSYYLLVKCLFDYYIKEQKKEEGIIEQDEDKDKNDENENNNEENEEDEKEKIDEEYRQIEENVGQNAELINKAFSRILNDNNKNKNKDKQQDLKKNKMKIEEDELETDLNKIKENQISDEIKDNNNEINNKLKPNDFLKMTMNLLNN